MVVLRVPVDFQTDLPRDDLFLGNEVLLLSLVFRLFELILSHLAKYKGKCCWLEWQIVFEPYAVYSTLNHLFSSRALP
jgi:hypothetical protein